MKRILLAGMLLTATLSATATTFYGQLCAFNFNWKNYAMRAPEGEARRFGTDAGYVAAHLGCVIPILQSNPTDQLSAEQLNMRLHLIGLLNGYRLTGEFPLNHYRAERIPVFIDEHGTHCAVGYLMMKSGYEELAQRIARTDNYVWVKDITDPEALVWQAYSGFTMDELKLIQGAYEWYDPMAWYVPNKYETPQMPACTTAYFTGTVHGERVKKSDFVWCKGEGDGKTINGKWEQNYGPGLPWIKGHFTNGKRTGDWEEYYPGTTTLCRTESWRNNKLNGVRKRFDRSSRLIEEIIFAEGVAVCKMNYDLYDSLAYVRIPQDSATVLTKVYNNQGALIACGYERIYNPSGLLWFQNIELTAMNSIQVGTRANQLAGGDGNAAGLDNNGGYNTGNNGVLSLYDLFHGGSRQPSLVQYHKIGTWLYYPEQSPQHVAQLNGRSPNWYEHYQHFGKTLHQSTAMFNPHTFSRYDSLQVEYADNYITEFYGFAKTASVHYRLEYYTEQELAANGVYFFAFLGTPGKVQKSAGQYNSTGERIDAWFYYNAYGQLERTETYLIPYREKDPAEKPEATAVR